MAGLNIIFCGSGEFGRPALEKLVKSHQQMCQVIQVISQPDRPAGRGRTVTPTPISQAAAELRLPLLTTADINAESLPESDLMVVIAFGQKIAEGVVHRPRLGSINLHASRLPRYRGAAPINWAIIRGDTIAGNSIIRLANRMDAGAILGQSSVLIGPTETAGELHDRLAVDGADLVLSVIEDLAAGRAREAPQDDSQATIAPKLSRTSACLDFARPADELARTIRGLSPWPGCRVKLCDMTGQAVASVRLLRATPAPADEGERWMTGEIMISGAVQAGDGAVEILELQPDGGKPMSLADYRRGRLWQPGLLHPDQAS